MTKQEQRKATQDIVNIRTLNSLPLSPSFGKKSVGSLVGSPSSVESSASCIFLTQKLDHIEERFV